MTQTQLVSWLIAAITFGTVIMYGAVGETMGQKAGNLNLGVPGVMQLGGIASLAGAFIYERSTATPSPIIGMLISLVCALLAAAAGGLIYAFLTVSLKVNQNVTGLTLTIFGTGVANFFGGSMMKLSGGVGTISVATTSSAFRAKLPFLFGKGGVIGSVLLSHGWMVYMALLFAIFADLFLTKTRVGLNLRAVGENPGTADAAGINVTLYKYLARVLGGAVSGLGGLFYVMDYIQGTWANDSAIEALGWLAAALVIFTGWKPRKAITGAYLFGVCYWAYIYIPTEISQAIASALHLTKTTYVQNLYMMLPYVVTIIVLCVVSSRKRREDLGPAALGLSYFREDR